MVYLSPEIGKNFCYAPWTNIHLNPQGSYKTCCGGGVDIADLRKQSIKEVYSSQTLIQIKKDLLDNKKTNNCDNCYRQESMSSVSERNWYDDISNRQIIGIDKIQKSYLQNLDIRWSTTCNLSCSYCSHDASSQWAAHKKIPIERLDYSNTIEEIVEFIGENKSTLRNLGLLGGEPLLQKENDLLLDVISSDVHINIVTNLSVPLENNKIFHKLLLKKNVAWDISFDTIEDRFEYVRHGADWKNQIHNIRYLQSLIIDKPGHSIGTAGVYSIYNALNLSTIHEYFKKNNLPIIRWNELHYPSILSVINLPKKFQLIAIKELESSIQYHSQPRQINFLQEMANNLSKISNNNKDCKELYKWHETQENTYWPDFRHKFSNLWPEYREI